MINPGINSGGTKLKDGNPLYIDTSNDRLGIGDNSPGTQLQLKGTTPYVTLQNSTAENTDGGCESKIIFEDHANATLAQIQGSHDGSSDDTKGDLIFSTHDGSSLDEALRIDSAQLSTFSGAVTVGTDGSGKDVTFYGDTSGDHMVWSASSKMLTITGTDSSSALYIADGDLTVVDNVDIDGNLDVDGTANLDDVDIDGDLDVDGTANLDNTDIDGTLTVDGSSVDINATTSCAIDNSNTSNGVAINTATSGSPVSIGHTTSETTVNDNLTVTGDLTANGGFKSYIGLNEITSTTYTFVIGDAGKLVTSANGSDQTLTVPANSAVAFPIGTQINVLRKGSGNTTIHTAGTPNLYAADGALVLRVQYSSCTLIKVATDTWYVIGDLTT